MDRSTSIRLFLPTHNVLLRHFAATPLAMVLERFGRLSEASPFAALIPAARVDRVKARGKAQKARKRPATSVSRGPLHDKTKQ